MNTHKVVLSLCCALGLALSGCSRQQSDWQKTRETNTADAYEQFLKKYPSGEFTAQAQARVKELYEERDWIKARDGDTAEAYQAFLKQYPDGKWAEEARIRVENFSLAQAPSGSPSAAPSAAAGAAVSPAIGAVPGAVAGAAPPAAAAPPVAAAPQHAKQHAKEPREVAATRSTGPYRVQLGAFKSGTQAAKERWVHLQHEYPHLLAGLSTKVLAKKTSAGSLYRLQAVGLTEKHAHALCTALRAKAEPCIVVPPA